MTPDLSVADVSILNAQRVFSAQSLQMKSKIKTNNTLESLVNNAQEYSSDSSFTLISDRFHYAYPYPPKMATVRNQPAASASLNVQQCTININATNLGSVSSGTSYLSVPSTPMFPHPWSMQASVSSLDMTASGDQDVTLFNNDGFLKAYKFIFAPFDFSVSSVVLQGTSGFYVDSSSDFHLTLKWDDLGMQATFGRGMAFVHLSG